MLDAHNVDAPAVCVQHRQPSLEYFVEHCNGHLLILTNHSPVSQQDTNQQGQLPAQEQQQHSGHEQMQDTAQVKAAQPGSTDYSLYTLPVAALQPGSTCTAHTVQDWRLLRAEAPGLAVTDMDVFEGCVVLHMLHNSRPQLTVLLLDTQRSLTVTHELEVREGRQVAWATPSAIQNCAAAGYGSLRADNAFHWRAEVRSRAATPRLHLATRMSTRLQAYLSSHDHLPS
jgi:protease II